MRIWVWATVLLGAALANPLLGRGDVSERLEQFLNNWFCQSYGCRFVERMNARRTYRLGQATVYVESLGGALASFRLMLPHPKQPPGPATLKLLSNFSKAVLGEALPADFNFAQRCLEPSLDPSLAVQSGRPEMLMLAGRQIALDCFWNNGKSATAGDFPPQIELTISVMV